MRSKFGAIKLIAGVTALMLIMQPATLAAGETEQEDTAEEKEAASAKEEVVYANLDAGGELEGVYVVNVFDLEEDGSIVDYGTYDTVKNLTNENELKTSGDKITAQAERGRFYYQGNVEKTDLPWDVSVLYTIDGKSVSHKDIAGKTGELEIRIKTTHNENMDESFWENYLLQVSLTLDSDICENIQAQDATIANAGSDKQITFTVMPSTDGDLTVKADVKDFEMGGITVAAVPFSMAFDVDTENLTSEFGDLTDAIEQLSTGVSQLLDGVSEISDGATELSGGSSGFNSGLKLVGSNGSALVSASAKIGQALNTINNSLSAGTDIDLSQLEQITAALEELGGGLSQVSSGLGELDSGFSQAYAALAASIEAIDDSGLDQQSLGELQALAPDNQALQQLLSSYQAAQTVKGTYQAVREAFDAVNSNLGTMALSINTITASLAQINSGLSAAVDQMDISSALAPLTSGVSQLAGSFSEFHGGLKTYTDGVSALATAYGSLDEGIDEMASGISGDLLTGVSELNDGTSTLNLETQDLPEKVQEQIDEFMSDYDMSDFSPVSFVSGKNGEVSAVQFVIQTAAIEIEEDQSDLPEEQESAQDEGFFARFFALFK